MATTDEQERQPSRLEDAADAFLVDRAADGDARAFAVLVRRYGRLLHGAAYRVLGSSSSVDDVVQEALITAWNRLETLQDRSAVRGWFVRITTRKALEVVRGTRYQDDVDEVDPPEEEAAGPEAAARVAELDDSLAAALGELPAPQREAWVRRELAEESYEEIAEALGVPVSTVRGLLARARRTLILKMDGWR